MVCMIAIAEKEGQRERILLEKILDKPSQHVLFLNTISLMEHIGSRKILLTQSNAHTTEFILRHASEEARHALFFKKKIELIIPNASVRKSIRDMDLSNSKRTYLNYLYTTTVIEIRATKLYKIYNEVLSERNFGFHLNGLLAEEEGHLAEMESEIDSLDSNWSERLNKLLEQEGKLYQRLWRNWEEAIFF
jgi:hypothetical protein